MRSLSLRRPWLILAAAVAMLASSVAPALAAPPEIVTGQHGHYLFNDSSEAPLANCKYSGSNPWKLVKIVAKPPPAWWSDLDSNKRDKGTIGLQIALQENNATADLTWKTVDKSPMVKKTAYEDKPLYDTADAAPFGAVGINYAFKADRTYRIIYVLVWYWPNGTKGKVKHWPGWYNFTGTAPKGTPADWCASRIKLL